MICSINGKFHSLDKATIGIQDLAILRGYGVFDFVRLSSSVPLFIDDHLERFYCGAETVRLDPGFDKLVLKNHILELIAKNQMPQSGLRIILTGGIGGGPYGIGNPNLIIIQEPFSFPPPKNYENGVKVITHEYLRDIPNVKTINYMTGIWLQEEIIRRGAFDVLYTYQGEVHEFTRSNVFIVTKKNVMATPVENILKGVTRKKILNEISIDLRMEERVVSMEELLNAQEVFLTGTTKRVLPVIQIGDQIIGSGRPGPVTRNIMEAFRAVEADYVRARLEE